MTEEMMQGLDALIQSHTALVAAVRELADSIQAKPGRETAVQAVKASLARHEAPLETFAAHMRRFL